MFAVSLLKHVYARIDYEAEPFSLQYLRTKEKHKVDIAIVLDNKIEKIIEVKSGSDAFGLGLKYFHEKYLLRAVQAVKDLKHERLIRDIEMIDAHRFLRSLVL